MPGSGMSVTPGTFIVTPPSHDTTVGVPTGDYTIAIGPLLLGDHQDFTLDDGGHGGIFSPGSTVTITGSTVDFTYKNSAVGTYTLTVTPSGGGLAGVPSSSVLANVGAGSPPPYHISPASQTTLPDSDTDWYTITLDVAAGVGGQAFNLSDAGGDGIFWPSGTVTVPAGQTTVQFAYRNSAAGIYTLSATPVGGALSGDPAQTTQAIVESNEGGSMSTGIINPDGMIFAEGYLTATANGGTADHVVFGKLQDITVKDTYSLKEAPGPESLGAVAVAASEAKVTLTAKFMVINAQQWAMLRGSTLTHAVGPPSTTTITRGVNDQPKPFTCHFKTPVDGTDAEFKFYGCVCPDLGADIKLHDWVTYDVTINVYGDLTQTPARFYDLILPGDQTA